MNQLLRIVSQRLGLKFGARDAVFVQNMLAERSRRLALGGEALYAQFLRASSHESESEWKELTSLLTVGETYFFRGASQIRLLRNTILPDLIERRSSSRELRVWSAGCSSGEEAYTIAILLDELLPSRDGWRLTVLGTDIDHEALAKAEQAIYTDWSFRNAHDGRRERYFQQCPGGWEIASRIKRLVSFQPLNLINDFMPNGPVRDMDLIVCRNVFIYFEPEHIASVFEKFATALRYDGYLLTGHGELQNVDTRCLTRHLFDESLVYQRIASVNSVSAARSKPNEHASRSQQAPTLKDAVVYECNSPDSTSCASVAELLRSGQAGVALEQAELLAKDSPEDPTVDVLLANAHADLGNLAEAETHCARAIEKDSLAVEPHYLLAKLAEADGNLSDAKSHLRRVIYLDPCYVAAFLDFAELFRQEGDTELALKHRQAAVDVLERMPDDDLVRIEGEPSVRELREYLQEVVSHG